MGPGPGGRGMFSIENIYCVQLLVYDAQEHVRRWNYLVLGKQTRNVISLVHFGYGLLASNEEQVKRQPCFGVSEAGT